MKTYIEFILKKEKKPIDLEKLFLKIQSLVQEKDPDYLLSDDDKKEIEAIVLEGVQKLDYYQTPNKRFVLLSKTSFRKGRFHGNRAGEGFVTVVTSYINREGKQIVREDKYSITKDKIAPASQDADIRAW